MTPDDSHHKKTEERVPDTAPDAGVYPTERIPALRTPTQYKIAMIVKRILLDESEWTRIVPAIERMVAGSQGREAAKRVMIVLRIWYDTELTLLREKISMGELSVREFGAAIEGLMRRFEATVEGEEKEEVIVCIQEKINAIRGSLDRTVAILHDIDRGIGYNPDIYDFPRATWQQLVDLYGMAHREYEDTIRPAQRLFSVLLWGELQPSPSIPSSPPVTIVVKDAAVKDTFPETPETPETNCFTAADIAAEIEELAKTAPTYGGMSPYGASYVIHLFLLEHLGEAFKLAKIIQGIRKKHPGEYTDGNIAQSASSIVKKSDRSEKRTFRITKRIAAGGCGKYVMLPKEKPTPQEKSPPVQNPA